MLSDLKKCVLILAVLPGLIFAASVSTGTEVVTVTCDPFAPTLTAPDFGCVGVGNFLVVVNGCANTITISYNGGSAITVTPGDAAVLGGTAATDMYTATDTVTTLVDSGMEIDPIGPGSPQCQKDNFLLSEISEGTPDFVEIANNGSSAAVLDGYQTAQWNQSVLPFNGVMTVALAGSIPAGGVWVIEDNGAPGTPSTAFPCGEHSGYNMSWAGGSWGEVTLYGPDTTGGPGFTGPALPPSGGGGLVPGNEPQGIDYIRWGFVGNVPSPNFRHNVPNGDSWWGTHIVRTMGAGLDEDMARVDSTTLGSPFLQDTDTADDWVTLTTALLTPCAPNGAVALPAATPVPDLMLDMFTGGSLAAGLSNLVLIARSNPAMPVAAGSPIAIHVSISATSVAAPASFINFPTGINPDGTAATFFGLNQNNFALFFGPALSLGADVSGNVTFTLPPILPPGLALQVAATAVVPGGPLGLQVIDSNVRTVSF